MRKTTKHNNAGVPDDVIDAISKIKEGLDDLGRYNLDHPNKKYGASVLQSINPTQVVDVEPPDDDNDVEPGER